MKLRNLLTVLLAAVFLASSAMALGLMADYAAGNDRYADLRSQISAGNREKFPVQSLREPGPTEPAPETLPPAEEESEPATVPTTEPPETLSTEPPQTVPTEPPETTPPEPQEIPDGNAAELASVDLEALRMVNAQVIGWLFIPGTNIDYPLVQGEDNQYYLEHTWDHEVSAVGAVFMEATNASDFSDYSTILYAHNLRAGTMFSELHLYKEQSFWEENPYVYIVSDEGIFRYAIYAAYEADVTGATYWRDVDSDLRKQEYVEYGLSCSIFDTGIRPNTDTPVLTLSTCTGYTYARRWVVQAVLEGPVIPPAE